MPSTPRPSRSDSPDVAELKVLRRTQPDLADAIDLQIGLLELQRRIAGRVPLPSRSIDAEPARQRHAAGKPLLEFDDIPLNWTDFRLMFRETAELLFRHEALDDADRQRAHVLAREGHALETLVIGWYTGTAPEELSDMLAQVVLLAMRPFLTKCADAMLPPIDLSGWRRRSCPLCGGEPDFATITPAAERLLICSRCTGRWPFDPLACPFCDNDDRTRITSLASRDGLYRIYACDVCRRYIKAYDGRRTSRPVRIHVDSIATLPLDAAAMHRGYSA